MVDTKHLRAYYKVGGVQAIDIIEDLDMLFAEGNAFKYLFRCNRYNPKGEIVEDLEKAVFYLKRAMSTNIVNSILKINPFWYIEKIDINAFSENIYKALCRLIEAKAATGSERRSIIASALKLVLEELDEIN